MWHSIIGRLREPAYTGRNRCYPCTVLNVTVIGVVAVGVGTVAAPTAIAVAGIGLAAVWLRGYVVPGTPRLTRRYLPDRLLALFGKSRFRRGGFAVSSGAVSDTAEPTELLATLGVLADANEPSLDMSFEDSWSATAGRLAEDEKMFREAAAEVLSVPSESVEIAVEETGGVALTSDGDWVGSWPSRTALVGDFATELTLAGEAWTDFDRVKRADLMARIRGLATECPVCGAETGVSDDTVESCCRSADVVAVTCQECGDRLAEFEQSPASFEPGA